MPGPLLLVTPPCLLGLVVVGDVNAGPWWPRAVVAGVGFLVTVEQVATWLKHWGGIDLAGNYGVKSAQTRSRGEGLIVVPCVGGAVDQADRVGRLGTPSFPVPLSGGCGRRRGPSDHCGSHHSVVLLSPPESHYRDL